jgi:tetratricopeptide (TPR) repeat protein
MRHPMPNIRLKLQLLREPRKPLASALVERDTGHFVVLTLVPLKAARLLRRGRRALWETRVHESEPEVRVDLGSVPVYAAFSAAEAEALARHEALVARLEAGTFETETGREVLAPVRPLMDRGAEAFKAGDYQGAVATFEEAIRTAGRLDAVRHFLHLYQEAFLMRALALECIEQEAAKAAYREFIQLYADSPSHHPDTLRGVAKAREAVERLTPMPHGDSARRRIQVEEQIARRPR